MLGGVRRKCWGEVGGIRRSLEELGGEEYRRMEEDRGGPKVSISKGLRFSRSIGGVWLS